MTKKYRITVNGQSYDVGVEEIGGNLVAPPAQATAASAPVTHTAAAMSSAGGKGGSLKSPMPGTVTSIKAKQGQQVKKGDVILLLEAMKMENDICAPSDGTITAIHVSAGATVSTGEVLFDIA